MSSTGFENIKALIVEDNMHMRSLLRALLKAIGVKDIIEVSNGQSAIDALRERKSYLVLTDLAMKPMDGLEFTRVARSASPNTLSAARQRSRA